MLNRTGKVVASATLITVSTLAFSSAALIRTDYNLNANNFEFGQEHSSNAIAQHGPSPIANLGSLANPQEPKAWGCWGCRW